MTPKQDNGRRNGHSNITNTVSNVSNSNDESNIADLFTIGASKNSKEETKPFIQQVQFHGPQGKIVRVWATIDDGAMKKVMLSTMFKKVKHRLGRSLPLSQLLWVANRAIIQSEAKWKGKIEVRGVSRHKL